MQEIVNIEFIPNVRPEINANTNHDSITNWLNSCHAYVRNVLSPEMHKNPNNETLDKATNQLKITDQLIFDVTAVFEAIDIAQGNKKQNQLAVIAQGKEAPKTALELKLEDMKKIAENIKNVVIDINSTLEEKNNASMSLLMLMNDKTFQDIQEIEKQVIYRRFYFPGGEAKKVIVTDNRELKRWDPRTIDEYIALARQQGFHRFFIYYNGFDFKPISFTQAATVLKNCVDWSTRRISEYGGCDKLDTCGIIAGMIYFDKVESFFSEIGGSFIGATETMFNRVWDAYGDVIDPMIDKIANVLVHQTQNNFKKNNYGWMAEDDRLAFDSGKYVAQLVTLKKQYEMYKDRVWKILEGLNAIEVCTNYTNITGNNLTIDQKMQCALTIEGQMKQGEQKRPAVEGSSTTIPNEDSSIIQGEVSQTTSTPTKPTELPKYDSIVPDNIMPDPSRPQNSVFARDLLSDQELFYAVIVVTIILFMLLLYIMLRKPKSQTLPVQQSVSQQIV